MKHFSKLLATFICFNLGSLYANAAISFTSENHTTYLVYTYGNIHSNYIILANCGKYTLLRENTYENDCNSSSELASLNPKMFSIQIMKAINPKQITLEDDIQRLENELLKAQQSLEKLDSYVKATGANDSQIQADRSSLEDSIKTLTEKRIEAVKKTKSLGELYDLNVINSLYKQARDKTLFSSSQMTSQQQRHLGALIKAIESKNSAQQ